MLDKPMVKRTILQRLPIPELPGYESRMVKLEQPPGTKGLVHYHPAAGPNYVASGTIISQFEGEDVEVFKEGEKFVDQKDKVHVRTDNASDTEWVVLIATYVIKEDVANVVVV